MRARACGCLHLRTSRCMRAPTTNAGTHPACTNTATLRPTTPTPPPPPHTHTHTTREHTHTPGERPRPDPRRPLPFSWCSPAGPAAFCGPPAWTPPPQPKTPGGGRARRTRVRKHRGAGGRSCWQQPMCGVCVCQSACGCVCVCMCERAKQGETWRGAGGRTREKREMSGLH